MTSRRTSHGGGAVVPVVLRAGASIALLLGLALWLDAAQIVARLSGMRSGWVLSALALSVVQVLVSAWRWRFTAGRLGIDLPLGDAVREYYLAMFVNQVLPGGVMGDVSRAWRHAAAQRRATSSGGPAIRAVVLERFSGQLVMVGVASASVLTLLVGSGGAAWVVVLVGLATVVVLRRWMEAPTGDDAPPTTVFGRLWHDTKVALLTGRALPIQLASSTLVVGSYVATYVMASLAVGIDTPLPTLVPLVAPVLVAMLVPASVAGWGVREAAAALLWDAAGLASEDGVVISITYGFLALVSSLPGCVALMLGPRRST